MIHVLMPEFIKENRMYWLRTPIYKVSVGKKDYFYYTEEEFKNHLNGSIVKYKGLGQLSEQDLRESMFNDAVQRLEPITYEESGKIALEQLMGTDVTPRKEFVNKIDFSNFEVE